MVILSYDFIGFEALDGRFPYEFIGFGALDDHVDLWKLAKPMVY